MTGVLMVMVNRRPDGVDVPSITPDDATGVELAVRHLASLGHRRIAHLAGPANTSTGVVRARAFRSTARDLGLAEDPALTATCELLERGRGRRGAALDAGRRRGRSPPWSRATT